MVDVHDAGFIERAFFLGERGRGRTAPNPVVGAVIVSSRGVVVGQGAHLEAGGPHAEVIALDAAGSEARDGTLYCTLEPCSHVGRTGPCVERIVGAGIRRVVFPIRDPNPRVSGSGAAYLRAHGVDVTEGIGEEQARRQNAVFLTWITRLRPYVIVKAAVSSDGFVGRSGTRVKLTGAVADRYLQRQRAEVEAIAVGSGTVLRLGRAGAPERPGVLDARCGPGHNDRVGAGGGDEPGAARLARTARRVDRSARGPDAGAAAQVARRTGCGFSPG
jgi:diaminohydroxyphosphoribosylaminopyrimidine deaminase/5-amino-6-(5-phosphoribosylamino)uracil reductase